MIDKNTLKAIRKVQLKMEHLSTEMLAGMYRSAFKGRGMEFEEVRAFQQGDDVRSIDWNVTARYGTPYIKCFREERELTIMLLVDISASTRFGSVNQLKSSILNEIAAVLAFSGIKNQDKIGLLLFTSQVEHYLPPEKGVRHVLRLIRDLMAFPAKEKGTDLSKALQYLAKMQKKRCTVFILSDFLFHTDYAKDLTVTAKTYDLISIAIQDPRDSFWPPAGLITLRDLETEALTLLDTQSASLNQSTKLNHALILGAAQEINEKSGATWLEISTARPYIQDLKRFFHKRNRRR